VTGFLTELGKKLAERWLSLLVLPGALFLAVTAVALWLGHRHALDAGLLIREVTAVAKTPVAATAGGQVVLVVAVLAGSAAIGVLVRGLCALAERLVLGTGWGGWPGPAGRLAEALVRRRRSAWDSARTALDEARSASRDPDPAVRPAAAVVHRARRALAKIAMERPERPTWSGDRIQAAAIRLDRDHHVDLVLTWPHLWLILPSAVRDEITAARGAITRAVALGTWAAPYTILIFWWWPAVLIVAVLAVASMVRTRIAVENYAQLIEATARLHVVDLARQLGLDHDGPATPQLGDQLYLLLTATPPPP
jgi:hypothetical protein